MQTVPQPLPPILYPDSAFQTYKGIKSVPKKFKCPHPGCDRSFAKSDHLRTHVRTHTGERPFRCTHDGCRKEFSDLANLKRHMRVHTGERPFTCPELGCGKQFSVSSNLKQHMRVHTGERPYSCPVCGKAFGHVSSRRKHMNIHEGAAFKTLVDKRSAVENFRKMSTQSAMSVSRWQHHMVRPEPFNPAHLMPHPGRIMLRRPSSRDSESSLESTSPVSYGPTIPRLSPGAGCPSHSPGRLAAAPPVTFFQTHTSLDRLRVPKSIPTNLSKRSHTAHGNDVTVSDRSKKLLKKEVSRPKPCYSSPHQSSKKENLQNNASSNNSRKFHDLASRMIPSREHHRRIRGVSEQFEQLKQDKIRVAGQILVARYAEFRRSEEMGRYITLMMDTSYKVASLLIYLYQNVKKTVPRQVPVRAIQ